MKVTGIIYEFDIVLLERMARGFDIDDVREDRFDAIPIVDGRMQQDQISVHYQSRRLGGSTHIIGYIYEDGKEFMGKIHYKADVLPVTSDIKGIFNKAQSSIFIYGSGEHDHDVYGYAIYLNSF